MQEVLQFIVNRQIFRFGSQVLELRAEGINSVVLPNCSRDCVRSDDVIHPKLRNVGRD